MTYRRRCARCGKRYDSRAPRGETCTPCRKIGEHNRRTAGQRRRHGYDVEPGTQTTALIYTCEGERWSERTYDVEVIRGRDVTIDGVLSRLVLVRYSGGEQWIAAERLGIGRAA